MIAPVSASTTQKTVGADKTNAAKLTSWCRNIITDIMQTTFSNSFSLTNKYSFFIHNKPDTQKKKKKYEPRSVIDRL